MCDCSVLDVYMCVCIYFLVLLVLSAFVSSVEFLHRHAFSLRKILNEISVFLLLMGPLHSFIHVPLIIVIIAL